MLLLTLHLLAAGSSDSFALGLKLSVSPNYISSSKKYINGVLSEDLPIEEGHSDETVIIFTEDFIDNFVPSSSLPVNTIADSALNVGFTFRIEIEFAAPVELSWPYSPFIYKTSENPLQRNETFFIDYSPSEFADSALFDTEDDYSVPEENLYYRDKHNLPWALMLPPNWQWPIESATILKAYPHFIDWVLTGGVAGRDWWKSPNKNFIWSSPDDSDNDTLPDAWELQYFDNLAQSVNDDPDEDSLMNIDEYLNTTDPTNPDTDADGIPDGWEAQYALDMKSNDSQNDPDNDDLTNLAEYANSTDPNNPDTDADGLPDGWEVENNFNPLSVADGYADDDNDFLSNREEYKNSTDYDNPDTDGDGLTDFEEIMTYHTDPLQISSFPLVNNKEQYTNSQTVSIKTFGPEATGIRVSLNRDMTDSTLFPNAGTEIVEYTLPEIDGQYFIYIDFYKNEESQSDIFTYRIILDTHEPIIQIESPLDGTTVQQLYVDLKAQMNSGVRYDKP